MDIFEKHTNKPKVIDDLKSISSETKIISISKETKNLNNFERLNPEQVWLFSLSQDTFNQIINLINPPELYMFGCRVENLSGLENLSKLETLVISWNTKCKKLWSINKNKSLVNLHLEDLSKIENLNELSLAKQLKYFGFEGGNNAPTKIESLEPIRYLTNLEHLRLMNLRLKKIGFEPLYKLKGLKKLDLPNMFPTEDFVKLSIELQNTDCDLFAPYKKIELYVNNELDYDTMITGSRKPFLNSKKDKKRIEKYINDWNNLIDKHTMPNNV